MGYTYVDVDSLEGEGPGGMVRKTRRATGARAFGFNYFTLPPGVVGREHDHTDSNQEEVYFVVRGSGTMRIDGDELELVPGRFVRVDPDSMRVPIASDEASSSSPSERRSKVDTSHPTGVRLRPCTRSN